MNLGLFIPEITMSALCLLCLCVMIFRSDSDIPRFIDVLLAGTLLLVAGTIYKMGLTGYLFGQTYKVDLLSQGFKILIALGYFLTLFISRSYLSLSVKRGGEYLFFLSTAALGMMMMASASDLLTLYVAMELSSYSLYLLTALRQDRRNAEASLKYLIFGAATSGLFLWGTGILMALSQSPAFTAISAQFSGDAVQPALLLGLIFTSFAFLFKLSAFPYHFWAPDVYESASTPVTNFIATASKAAAVAILVRVLMVSGVSLAFGTFLGIVAFISMTLGNTAALLQKDVKRLLAYSSIAQAGYILVGLLSGSFGGFSSTFFYAIAYVLMNTGVFLVVALVAQDIRHDNPQLSHFDGLAERSPLLALLLLVSLLSLAGIPPLAGFTGKWILFSASMQKGHWFLVLWAVLNSVVSLFYYLTLVKHAYLEKSLKKEPIQLKYSVSILCLVLFASMLLMGIFPDKLIVFSQLAVHSALGS